MVSFENLYHAEQIQRLTIGSNARSKLKGAQMNAKIVNFKLSHKSFERWRKKQKFATDEVANMAIIIGKNLRTLEKGGDSPTKILRRHIMEDLDKLRAALGGSGHDH